MTSPPTGIKRAIMIEGGIQQLADAEGVTYQAIRKFDRQNWVPLERAKTMAAKYDIPLRELVRPDIAEAMDA